MSTGQRNDTRVGTFIVETAAVAPNQLVKAGVADRSCTLCLAAATANQNTEDALGTTREAGAVGDCVGVFLLSKEGTMTGIAGAAVIAGEHVTGGTTVSGALDVALTTESFLGIALEDAAAAGDEFEFMPKTGVLI